MRISRLLSFCLLFISSLIVFPNFTVADPLDNWHLRYTSSSLSAITYANGVQADNLWNLEKSNSRGDIENPYPNSTGNASFTTNSSPNSNLYDGNPSNVNITSISASGPTTAATPSFQPVLSPFVGNLLFDPSFEMGPDWYWVEYSSGNYYIVSYDYLTKSWYAWLGGYDNAIDSIYQDVTVPSGVRNAYVDFFYAITTNETTNIYASDTMAVEIRRPNDNALLRPLVSLSNLNKSSDWVWSGEYDVSDFRGQTIRLKFVVTTDSALPTDFFVDDTGLWVTFLFSDIPSDHWAYDYIMAIYMACITTGCSQNPLKYCPEDNVTREQMAAFLVRAVEGEPAENYCDTGSPFSDVSSTMWSCRYIKRLYELGITTGYGDGDGNGTYGPYDMVPREQMAAFIVRAVEGEPAAGYCDTGSPFPDVTPDMWSCEYIKRLKELGITTGYQDGTYGPYDLVTRAQMAAFLARAFLGMP